MKSEIHPEYKDIKVVCSCGSTFITRSTLGKEQISLEVCAMCHPFYTGTQKIVDTAGRVDRFRQKYGRKKQSAEEAKPASESKTADTKPAVKEAKPVAEIKSTKPTAKAKTAKAKAPSKKEATKKADNK